jgi:hypothetical protein
MQTLLRTTDEKCSLGKQVTAKHENPLRIVLLNVSRIRPISQLSLGNPNPSSMGNASNQKTRSFLYPPHVFPPCHLHLYFCCQYIVSQFLYLIGQYKSSPSSHKHRQFTDNITLWYVSETIVARENPTIRPLCIVYHTRHCQLYKKVESVVMARQQSVLFVLLRHMSNVDNI